MRRVRICTFVAVLCALPATAADAAHPDAVTAVAERTISTHAAPRKIASGHVTTISGRLIGSAGPVAGELVELQIYARRFARFVNVAHARTATDGDYRFARLRLDHDTRFRVADVQDGGLTGPTVDVIVEPTTYPSSARVIAAADYLAARAGVTAFAVVDDEGKLAGIDLHRRFHSASVVKSMLLVAYLRMLEDQHRSLDAASQAVLYPMIHSSDNAAASAVLAIVGEGALDRVARDAHMQDYEMGGGWWGFTEVSAADLARFFFHQDELIPRRFDGYARWLLANIEPSESWGIPAVARPEFQVFFKGGWLPQSEGLVNQVGRLERPGITFAMSVLTTHDPSMEYGERTIEGVTARLLGRAG
jgi:Beta-lactamase enzyme family